MGNCFPCDYLDCISGNNLKQQTTKNKKMKKIIILIVILVSSSLLSAVKIQAATDTTNKTIIVPDPAKSTLIWVRESDIPASALKDLQRDSKIQKIEKDIEKIGEYVGVGKEIGMAIDTSLGALAYHIDKISQTNVGKFTMFMVGWKIMGQDAVGYLVGILMLFTFLFIWIWSWYKNFYRRSVPKLVEIQERKWYQLWKKHKVLETQDYKINEEEWSVSMWLNYGGASYLGHLCALVIGLLIIFLTAF